VIRRAVESMTTTWEAMGLLDVDWKKIVPEKEKAGGGGHNVYLMLFDTHMNTLEVLSRLQGEL
jgi:hypothetical protein